MMLLVKLIIWPCLEISIQDEVTLQRLKIIPKDGIVRLFGKILTNQNSIQEEIKNRLKSGNDCYYSVQNILSSSLPFKSFKIKIYRNIILPLVLRGCETWSLTLKEERKLRLFENRVLRRIFGPKRDEVTGEWRKPLNYYYY